MYPAPNAGYIVGVDAEGIAPSPVASQGHTGNLRSRPDLLGGQFSWSVEVVGIEPTAGKDLEAPGAPAHPRL